MGNKIVCGKFKTKKYQVRESAETTKQKEVFLKNISTEKDRGINDSKKNASLLHEDSKRRRHEQRSGKKTLDFQQDATVSVRKEKNLERSKPEERIRNETTTAIQEELNKGTGQGTTSPAERQDQEKQKQLTKDKCSTFTEIHVKGNEFVKHSNYEGHKERQHAPTGKGSANSCEKDSDHLKCDVGRQATDQKNDFRKKTNNLEHIETLRKENDDADLQFESNKELLERTETEKCEKKEEVTIYIQEKLAEEKRRTTTFPATKEEIDLETDYIDKMQEKEKQFKKNKNGTSTEIHLKRTDFVTLSSYEEHQHAPIGKESVKTLEKQNVDLKCEIGRLQKQATVQENDFRKKTEKLENDIDALRKEKDGADLQYERDKEIWRKDLEKAQNELIMRNEIILQLETSLQKEKDEKSKQLSTLSDIGNLLNEYEIGDSLQSENNAVNDDLFKQVKKGVQRLVDEIQSLKEDKTAQMMENKNLEKQVANLKEESNKLDTIVTSLKEEKLSLQDSLKTLKQESEAMDTEKSEKLDELSKRIIELEKALALKDQEYRNAKVENDSMKAELEIIKSKKIMHVQLYHFNRVSLVSELEEELRALLKSKLEDAKTELDFTECNEAGDVNKNLPLLIVCISASRLGTDVKNAIQSLKLTPNMALIIFHHKDLHALPNQASERVLTGDVFSRVGGVYDFAFLSGKGIYDCDMNQRNIQRLVIFLKREEL